MKKVICLLLCAVMLLGLIGCGSKQDTPPVDDTTAPPEDTLPSDDATEPETIEFTDSTGRTQTLPSNITRVAPSGAVATMILSALCPDYMVCVNTKPSETEAKYLPASLSELPEVGQMYGSKANLNLESLISADAQIIIDLGDPKDGIGDDLDALTEQTGLPAVYIQSNVENMAEAFRTLGKLLKLEERAEEIASFIDETVNMVKENSAKIAPEDVVTAVYGTGADGLSTNANGSTQAQVLDLVGVKNAVEVEEVNNKGGGNPIDMEQLLVVNPDVILLTADGPYDTIGNDATWQQLTAVQTGKYYEIPGEPYNWLSGPPSMNMIMGMWWLGNLVYPEIYDYDMVEVAQEIFMTLWGYELTTEEAEAMLANSTLKAAQ